MDSQDQLFLELLYPPIADITQFVNALPKCVVDAIILDLDLRDRHAMESSVKRVYIRIMLRQPKNNPIITPIIWNALANYHGIQT